MTYLFFYTWLISFSIMSFKFIHVAGYSRISFHLRQNIILLYVYIISPLSIYPSMSIYVLSISRLLWITLRWMLECQSIFKIMFSTHLDIYAEMGLLDHMPIFNFLTNFCISSFLYSQQCTGFQFLQSLGNICYIFVGVVFDNHDPNDHVNDIH